MPVRCVWLGPREESWHKAVKVESEPSARKMDRLKIWSIVIHWDFL